jgi:hypothetical protein
MAGLQLRSNFQKSLDKGLVLWYNIGMKIKIKNKEVQ